MKTLEQALKSFTAPAAEELSRRLDDGRWECLACGHRCRIADGRPGVCRVRYVEGGVLRRPRGYVAGLALDPIEKKPFFHAYPGREALTFGMVGCDLHCAYCQNWETSQALRDDEAVSGIQPVSAEEIAAAAVQSSVPVVVSSYNEPLITADWAVEIFRLVRDKGIACAFVSNGNATPEVLEYLRPFVSLFKVDLKSFREESYRELGAKLENVLETLRVLKRLGFWVEIVTLLVPGFNDDPGELRAAAEFLVNLDANIPWHITAFHPDYRMMDHDRTTAGHILKAYEIGKSAGLRFVYMGNLPGQAGDRESTFCPGCGSLLIRRNGFLVLENRMRGNRCPSCQAQIPGVWEEVPPTQTSCLPRRVHLGR